MFRAVKGADGAFQDEGLLAAFAAVGAAIGRAALYGRGSLLGGLGVAVFTIGFVHVSNTS